MLAERARRIEKLMLEMVALPGRTGTADENLVAEYIDRYLRGLTYFQQNPSLCGLVPLHGDSSRRQIAYGLIKGRDSATVVLSGHVDVVDEADYGEARALAFQPGEALEAMLRQKQMNAEQRQDMESGAWIWGKGTADMKGGLAIHLALLAEYSEQALAGKLEGSVLFMAVPDEESYSAGMRAGVALLAELKRTHQLDYRMLLNPEPTDLIDGEQVMYLGSVGKTMPVVMVQGVSAHIGHCFDGFQPLSLLSGIFARTSGSLAFVDQVDREATMPPSWLKMRDLKEVYDVSLPARAAGYFTVLSLHTTPAQIMEKLRAIAEDVCRQETAKEEETYRRYKQMNRFETKPALGFAPRVCTFGELYQELKAERGSDFTAYYEGLYRQAEEKILHGELHYPDATLWLMERVLDYADSKTPLVLLAFAPPYYPALNADEIPGRASAATEAFQYVRQVAAELGQPMTAQHFFMGISDNSYAALPAKQGAADAQLTEIAAATPLWGRVYDIDFASMAELQMPAVILGPIGKEYHRWSERVMRDSLLRVMPEVTDRLIRYLFRH